MSKIGTLEFVSTPNDHAVMVHGKHGSTMTYGVCKWQDADGPWVIWSAMQTSDGYTRWNTECDSADDYSSAVALIGVKAQWYADNCC